VKGYGAIFSVAVTSGEKSRLDIKIQKCSS
jgi:hypothetical protein